MPHMHRTVQVIGLQPFVVTVDMDHTRERSRVLNTTCGAMALHKDNLQILRNPVFVATGSSHILIIITVIRLMMSRDDSLCSTYSM